MSNLGAPEPTPTTFRLWNKDGVRILSVSGPLTISNIFRFQEAWRIDAKAADLVLDLAEVPYADSAAVGSIVNAHVSRQNGGRRVVVVVVDRVQKVLQITKVETLFPVCHTVDEAIATIKP